MRKLEMLLASILACGGPGVDADVPTDGDDDPREVGKEVSYTRDVVPIWDRHCGTCHFVSRMPPRAFPISPSLDLPSSREQLLATITTCVLPDVTPFPQRPLIAPGDPLGSALTDILDRRERWGCWGTTMPRSQPGTGQSLKEIAPDDFDVIWRWIEQGAPDN